MGHVLVFGHVQMEMNFFQIALKLFLMESHLCHCMLLIKLDTQVDDLLNTSLDYWYYDTTDGYLYYDHDSDQSMEDAVQIAKVTDNLSTINKRRINSSDITYDHGSTI